MVAQRLCSTRLSVTRTLQTKQRSLGCRPFLRRRDSIPWVEPTRRPSLLRSASIDISSIATLIEDVLAKDYADGLEERSSWTAEELQNDAEFQRFKELSEDGNLIPLFRRVFSDHLTSVLAYRCLTKHLDKEAPSFLLESVVNGNQNGRFSFVGARPAVEVSAKGNNVVVLDHSRGTRTVTQEEDPIEVPIRISREWRPVPVDSLPEVFTGGWVGYAGYDTVRYVYPGKLSFDESPDDDRGLPDMHFALYKDVMIFDNVGKVIYMVSWTNINDFQSIEEAYLDGYSRLSGLCKQVSNYNAPRLLQGYIDLTLNNQPKHRAVSNMTKEEFSNAIDEIKEHINAGDIFQMVYSQRFERRTFANPFEIYRALRVVNPSPYMVYLQTRGCVIVASSPEILCKVDNDRIVTNRPLAGTRPRGSTLEQDLQLQEDLLADEKEKAEHIMLVDLGRNDVGKVAKHGTVKVEKLMAIERYSHVMHISSTVTGELKSDLDGWDALRAALPAGTISGAPKVRAMQIIDEQEPHRRGPYGGGIGHVSFTGSIDMALALRTMVVPQNTNDTLYKYKGAHTRREWTVHIQAGAGIVADSVAEKEYEETVNKAAALGRAIDLAEQAFLNPDD